jgi:hypothetical protein
MTQRRSIDYGPWLCRKDVWPFKLPEVEIGFQVPNVSALFCAPPAIWNSGASLVAQLVQRVCCKLRARQSDFESFDSLQADLHRDFDANFILRTLLLLVI